MTGDEKWNGDPPSSQNERDFRLCHGYAETRWRSKHSEGGMKKREGAPERERRGEDRDRVFEATLCMAAMIPGNALMHRYYPGVMFNG